MRPPHTLSLNSSLTKPLETLASSQPPLIHIRPQPPLIHIRPQPLAIDLGKCSHLQSPWMKLQQKTTIAASITVNRSLKERLLLPCLRTLLIANRLLIFKKGSQAREMRRLLLLWSKICKEILVASMYWLPVRLVCFCLFD